MMPEIDGAPSDCAFLIKDSATFFEFLDRYAVPGEVRRIFRGHAKWSYELQPGIAREKTKDNVPYTEDDEDLLFRHFKERAIQYLDREYDDASLWAIAQHYGLPTRLLDWSRNPLVAAYFATEHSQAQPEFAAIVIFENYPEPTIGEKFSIRVDRLKIFAPTYSHSRIEHQRGLFSVHPHPWTRTRRIVYNRRALF